MAHKRPGGGLPALLLPLVITAMDIRAETVNTVVCGVPYSIMYAIASNERHIDRDIGYPYLISMNTKRGKRFARKHYPDLMLDGRTIDCQNAQRCGDIAKKLLDAGVTNIDLGAFQINYKYHPGPLAEFFDLSKSYAKACNYVEKLARDYGWSWATVGMYHSFTPTYRNRYAKNAYNTYLKILQQGESVEKQ